MKDDSKHPFRTPVVTLKQSESWPLYTTLQGHSLIRLLNDCNDLFRDTVVFKRFPQCGSVHTVKGLLIMNKVDVER